jgi:hypothetical protein
MISKKGKEGRSGQNGHKGQDGSAGMSGAAGGKGRPGSEASIRYFVLDSNGGVLESADSIYHPVIEVSASDGDGDGIFSPGDTITLTIRSVFNKGGLTLPAGAVLYDSVGNLLATLPHVPPQQACVVDASFTNTVPFPLPPTNPGVYRDSCNQSITIRFEDKAFMEYRPCFTARWPFKIDTVNVPQLLSPGDYKQVAINIANISKYGYGAQSALQVAIKLPQGFNLPVAPDSIDNGVQKWVMNTNDELSCSFMIAMSESVFVPHEKVQGRIELYWKGTFIEFTEFSIKMVPKWSTYLEGPPADVIVLHDNITSVHEYLAWSKVANQLNLNAYYWDANYYAM